MRGYTERTKKLREKSVSTAPTLSIERARSFTASYKQYEGSCDVPVLRARAFYDYMTTREIHIEDGELIVGEKGVSAQCAPTFPELCCHSVEDMRVMNDRELINFKVSEDDIRIQREEIIPYWGMRSIREKIMRSMSQEWKDCYSAGMFTEFMEQRGPGHTGCGGNIYKKGFSDFKAEIEACLECLDFKRDLDAYDKRTEYEAMKICCDAIIKYGERYAALAAKMAESEQDPVRRAELLQIAENCRVVPAKAPQTFWQALQMYWFVHIGVTTEVNPWDAFTPGRLDQHLFPFYEKDSIGYDMARELLECLWIKFNNQPAPPKVGITLKESSTYTDFANINTGGITESGQNGVNAVSYIILDVMEEMRLLQPSSNVQISRKTPPRFLNRACEISRQGWGQPAFYNTEAIVAELLNAGKSIEDARCGSATGCVETGCLGKESYVLTGYFNIPKVLAITLNDGFDTYTNKQLGLRTGTEFATYEALYDAFVRQMHHFIDIKIQGNNIIEKIFAKYMPVPFLSIVMDDCIKKGVDYNAGGARYNTNYIQGVGIGTITDSLSALRYCVYDKKMFSLSALRAALANDFEGAADILDAVNNAPKYGNDDDYADSIMKAVFDEYCDYITGTPTVKGGVYKVDMLPTTCHVYFGSVIGALPCGRKAQKPVSEGISPEKGADRHGPTAVINSCAKMDHLKTGGTLLNQKFTPSVLKGEEGINNLGALIKTYFELDGHHIQFNVIDRATLLDAQKRPEEYRELIVRVAGYSDYFCNLSKALQDEIIERTEQSF
ncbi:MAG: glycyl radical protein [Clostridia bacterium]|nr:glycyl radical protein [Clostridia bacterium]